MSPIMPDLLGVGTSQPRLNLTGAATPAQAEPLANAWKVGEILQARVLGASGAGMTRLDINGLEVSTKAPLPLGAGDQLDLQVTQPGPPPQLRILQHRPAQQDVLDQALRQALPRGAGGEVLPRLMDMLQRAATATEWSPSQRQALQQLQQALPSLARLSDPARLEQQIRASGLFLEHDLAHGGPQPGDLKVALLRVLASLGQPTSASTTPDAPRGESELASGQGVPQGVPHPRASAPEGRNPGVGAEAAQQRMADGPPARAADLPAPPPGSAGPLADTLRHAVEGALARLHLNQLGSLQSQDTDQPQWIMEFPLPKEHGEEPLRLRLERDGRGGGGAGGESGWRIDLDFSLEPLGPLRASVLMRGEQLNVRLWAERPDTLSRVQGQLDLLDSGLRRTGLEVAHLACYPGQPPTPRPEDAPRPPGGLVDISA